MSDLRDESARMADEHRERFGGFLATIADADTRTFIAEYGGSMFRLGMMAEKMHAPAYDENRKNLC